MLFTYKQSKFLLGVQQLHALYLKAALSVYERSAAVRNFQFTAAEKLQPFIRWALLSIVDNKFM